jgi:hypothetical protein
MPGLTHRSALVRSGGFASATLALGLLVAGCDAGTVDTKQDAAAVNSAAAPSRTTAPANEADPYPAFAARRQVLIADAVEAFDETYAALGLLAKQDNEGAADALARATGKLEVVLTAEPGLALAPVAVNVRTYDVIATPADVDRLRRRAEEALDDGQLQVGRMLISDLASEHVFSVTNLPLATYPDALKQAAALITSGRSQEAVAMLEGALATLVVEETIVPLPLVRAQILLERARPTAEQTAQSSEGAAAARPLLAQARQQLDLARALGYATREDLDALYGAVEEIEASIDNKDGAPGLFDRLKGLFDKARQSATTESDKRSSGDAGQNK